MRYFRAITVLAGIFLLLCSAAANAEIRITSARLSAQKINPVTFGIANISNDGKVVTAYEKMTDPKIKQKGTVYKYWIFEFNGKTRDDVKITGIMLPITDLQNSTISPDGKTCIITAERGSKFLKVDVPTKKVTVLFSHKKGVPGFRCDGGIVQYYDNNNVGAVGYFYDKKDVLEKKANALLDLSKTGSDIFKLGHDTTIFEHFYAKAKYVEWFNYNQSFIVAKFKEADGKECLALFDKGKTKILDRSPYGYKFVSGGNNKAVYNKIMSVNDKKEAVETDVFIIDAVTGKSVKVTPDKKDYTYLTMSKDGSTAVLGHRNLKTGRDSYVYGNEAEGWKMKPIAALQNTPLSQIRVAYNGKACVTWDGNQLIWEQLP